MRLRRTIPVAMALIAATAMSVSPALARKAPGSFGKASRGVIGGTAASVAEWPFLAELHVRDPANPDARPSGANHFCTGSVIGPQLVLTAAHCVVDMPTGQPSKSADRIGVLTGSTTLSSGGQLHAVSEVLVPPGVSSWGEVPDVALLRLATPTTAPAVELATPAMNASIAAGGSPATAAGWGLTLGGNNDSVPDRALQVPDEILPARSKACRDWETASMPFNPAFELCAGTVPGFGVCQGDSGGPLVMRVGARVVQVGITSRGDALCRQRFADVFTAAGAETTLSWITQAAGSAPGTVTWKRAPVRATVQKAELSSTALDVTVNITGPGSRSFEHLFLFNRAGTEMLWHVDGRNNINTGPKTVTIPLRNLPPVGRQPGALMCISSATPGFMFTAPNCRVTS